jgi:hypothetical protein
VLREKKIVHDPYIFAGPLRSALPPPPWQKLPFGRWVIVGHGLRGHVAPQHCARMIARPHGLWVIVGHSLFITHIDTQHATHKLGGKSLWAVWAVVEALFNRAPPSVYFYLT